MYSHVLPCITIYYHVSPCITMYSHVLHVSPCITMYSHVLPCTAMYYHVLPFCGCEWRHMIAVAMQITTKRLIIHEAESTHKYHHKHPLEIRSTRKKNWNKRLTKHLGNLKKTLVKLQVISRWPRARQCRGPVRMLLINKGVSPLVRIPAVTRTLQMNPP